MFTVVPNDETGLWDIQEDGYVVCSLESESVAYTFAAAHDLLFALDTTTVAFLALASHPAFANGAPEFNEGGIGYEAMLAGERAIDKARSDSSDENTANRERHARR